MNIFVDIMERRIHDTKKNFTSAEMKHEIAKSFHCDSQTLALIRIVNEILQTVHVIEFYEQRPNDKTPLLY